MTDKSTTQQVLGVLMQQPQLLSRVDKYNLVITDFSSRFEKYIFTAILGLYRQNSKVINPIDVANFLETNAAAKQTFELNNGIEYLQDIIEFSEPENFQYYYDRLKKINLLRDLKKQGFDTKDFYIDDLTNDRAIEVNENFENLSTQDICNTVKEKILHLESHYVANGEVSVEYASDGIDDLLENLQETISVGIPIQGDIYNKVINGAERGALTIRSGSSGLGKTRQAVADACYLAYPIRYDSNKREWIKLGNNEKVLFIITEQTKTQIRKMILSYLSDINESRFKYGNYTDEENKILAQAIEVMKKYESNFIIMQDANPTIESIKILVREQCLLHNISCVFYDYIFIGPALLNEFRGFSLRNDEVLLMFATALKDLAVELNVAMFTSTQVNASADDNKHIRNEASLAGGRATINKADNGAIMARPTPEELEVLEPVTKKYGIPNVVTDVFKVRSGAWTNIRIWSIVDLGRMKKQDLFITDERLEPIQDFYDDFDQYQITFSEEEELLEIQNFLKELNK